MAWNEPGGSKSGKDPWGGQGDGRGPPDLDEVVRKLQEKFGGLFGGGRKGGGPRGGAGRKASLGIGTIAAVVIALWAFSGIYIVHEGSQGVILRFGKYQETLGAGLHWHIPYPVESVQIVNVEEIRTSEIGYRTSTGGPGSRSLAREALMLTQDENIVDIKLAVQYRIKDAREYLFNVANPDLTLTQAVESALREITGKSTMDFILTEGRAEIVARTGALAQEILDRYASGVQITSVNMQDAQPPEEVQDAFNDAVKAREDEERLRNEAEAYSNDILPRARGQAARLTEEASAYQSQVVAQAEGDASRFNQILAEYKKTPNVMRERLYLDAMESIMKNATKVVVDVKAGNNLFYLPLDRLVPSDGRRVDGAHEAERALSAPQTGDDAAERARQAQRERAR
jgi:membrane protease subunit HflK